MEGRERFFRLGIFALGMLSLLLVVTYLIRLSNLASGDILPPVDFTSGRLPEEIRREFSAEPVLLSPTVSHNDVCRIARSTHLSKEDEQKFRLIELQVQRALATSQSQSSTSQFFKDFHKIPSVILIDHNLSPILCDIENSLKSAPFSPKGSTPSSSFTPLSFLIGETRAATEPEFFLNPIIYECKDQEVLGGVCLQWTGEELKKVKEWIEEYVKPNPKTGRSKMDSINGRPLFSRGGRNIRVMKIDPHAGPFHRGGYADLSMGVAAISFFSPIHDLTTFIHEVYHLHDGSIIASLPEGYGEGTATASTELLLESRLTSDHPSLLPIFPRLNSLYEELNTPDLIFGDFQEDKSPYHSALVNYYIGAVALTKLHYLNGEFSAADLEKFRLALEKKAYEIVSYDDERLKKCLGYQPGFLGSPFFNEQPAYYIGLCVGREAKNIFAKTFPQIVPTQTGEEWWQSNYILNETNWRLRYVLEPAIEPSYLFPCSEWCSPPFYQATLNKASSSLNSIVQNVEPTISLPDGTILKTRERGLKDDLRDYMVSHSLSSYTARVKFFFSVVDPKGKKHERITYLPIHAEIAGDSLNIKDLLKETAGVIGVVDKFTDGFVTISSVQKGKASITKEVENGVFIIPEYADVVGPINITYSRKRGESPLFSQWYIKTGSIFYLPLKIFDKPLEFLNIEFLTKTDSGFVADVRLSRPAVVFAKYGKESLLSEETALSEYSESVKIFFDLLQPNTEYEIQFIAVDELGNFHYSDIFKAKTLETPPPISNIPVTTNLNEKGELPVGQPLILTFPKVLDLDNSSLSLNFSDGLEFICSEREFEIVKGKTIIKVFSDDNCDKIVDPKTENFNGTPLYFLDFSLVLQDENAVKYSPTGLENKVIISPNWRNAFLKIYQEYYLWSGNNAITKKELDFLGRLSKCLEEWNTDKGKDIALGGGDELTGECLEIFESLSPAQIRRYDVRPVHKNGILVGDGQITKEDLEAIIDYLKDTRKNKERFWPTEGLAKLIATIPSPAPSIPSLVPKFNRR